MHMESYICNVCGEKFQGKAPFRIRHHFGYESGHDGKSVDGDICPVCCDRLNDMFHYINEQCSKGMIN